jgi:uncharacterized membrane protein
MRLLEIILGLPKGFLSHEGSFYLQFNPTWPLQSYVGGATLWNLALVLGALALVVHVYRREGRTRRVRIILGVLRAAVLGLVLILLNRPVLTLGQVHKEPSVLAILIDDSISMKVRDAAGPGGKAASRLDAAVDLFTGDNAQLLRKLAATHDVRLYEFSRSRHQISAVDDNSPVEDATAALAQLKPEGDATQLVPALQAVLEDLQGQRVAGVAVLTDGRQTPSDPPSEAIAAVKNFGVKIFPIVVGTDRAPQNIAVQSVECEPSAFVDDITNMRVRVRATGYEPNHPMTLSLLREVNQNGKLVRVPITDESGQAVTKSVTAADDKPFDVDMQFKPSTGDMPSVNVIVQVDPQDGELDDQDNVRKVPLAVLDNNIAVLYVDGYPRWDYRYIKNSMLRDSTVKISCLLTSADPTFLQEGSDDVDRPSHTWAITGFPMSMDQLMDYDVVLLGDVDPRQFTDSQLQIISDFVSRKGGGFEMVAGPRWSPQAYRNTPLEPLLPVIITHTQPDDSTAAITQGFRIALTKAGEESPIFRFFADTAANDEFLKNHLQNLFWYCRNVMAKPGVGIVFAEHPTDLGPDNRKAPILVAGRFGAGRTLFSAIDDSWRWRFYTGETTFNTYWIEQLRYLARGRKLGQRKFTFTRDQDVYDLGKQVTLNLRLLAPELIQQLSSPIGVEVVDDATGQPVRRVDLNRQEGASDVYSGSFTADRIGDFTAKLPRVADQDVTLSYTVQTPQLELDDPRIDVAMLSRVATDAPVTMSGAAAKLESIRSAARIIPIDSSQPLWNAPLAMIVFVVLITLEWVLRKMHGML